MPTAVAGASGALVAVAVIAHFLPAASPRTGQSCMMVEWMRMMGVDGKQLLVSKSWRLTSTSGPSGCHTRTCMMTPDRFSNSQVPANDSTYVCRHSATSTCTAPAASLPSIVLWTLTSTLEAHMSLKAGQVAQAIVCCWCWQTS